MNKFLGKLYLIPTFLSRENKDEVSLFNLNAIYDLQNFIVENEKSARRYLKIIEHPLPQNNFKFELLNEHDKLNNVEQYLEPIFNGENIGLMSDCGCPAVADPGNIVVKAAHDFGIKVIPLIGGNAILLALMASGLNGQSFAFNGYLPIEKSNKNKAIHGFESHSKKNNQTQIFIETPYRNVNLFNDLKQQLNNETLLCIAFDINGEHEYILTQSIKDWKKMDTPDFHKKPCVFLFLAK
jgi:16S rRNA (cytidine1402-2'-O)-methyltransferase